MNEWTSDSENGLFKRAAQGGFWLSVLLHLALFLALLSLMAKNQKEVKQVRLPHDYVPAYTYSGSIKPTSPHKSVADNRPQTESRSQPTKAESPQPVESKGQIEDMESVEHTLSPLRVIKKLQKMPAKKLQDTPFKKSLLTSSFNMLKEQQLEEISEKPDNEPIYMIGDDSQPADPLIKLLGRSLSAHFRYPHMAGQLGIRGRAIVGLTLHPEGYYSHVQLLQSSNNPDLDAAALYAVNAAPKIDGADRFIEKPKHFVIGFVFY